MKDLFEIINDEQETYSDDSLYNITSFGTDMTFREIMSMYVEGDIEKPELQRKYVWTKKEASRFIDSILLGLPVPSIFLAKTSESKLLIVDGYQRIMTVHDYIDGKFSGDGSLFRLTNSEIIHSQWRGKSYSELTEPQKRALRMYTIHAIVFEQKHPQNDTGMYQIFERINTGGQPLKPQEIRNCVYHGKFNSMLTDLNHDDNWRKIVGSEKEDSRMLDIELILRFFAFNGLREKHFDVIQINLIKYLNDYMSEHNSIDDFEREQNEKLFRSTMSFLFNQLGSNCFRTCKNKDGRISWSKKVNPVVMDAVSVATIIAKENNCIDDQMNYANKYIELLQNPDFISVTKSHTTKIDNINKRVELAAAIIYGIEI